MKISYLQNNLKMLSNIKYFDEIDSTNNYLKNQNQNNLLVIANKQTSGKGRLGRTFISEADKGIYMSLLIKPNIELENITKITCLVAVSIKEALEKFHIDSSIKWVNDIYINNKKIAGILVESQIHLNKLDYLIIGIGINLYGKIENEEIKNLASTIEEETKITIEKEKLIIQIINNIYHYLKNFDVNKFMEKYINASCVIGKEVCINQQGTIKTVFVKGINDEGELVIIDNHKEQIIRNGEITRMIINE